VKALTRFFAEERMPPKLAELVNDHPFEDTRTAQLGELIRDLRRARGMTLQDLADQAGKSVGYMSQIERNKSTLTIAALMSISQVLGVPMNWFFQDSPDAASEERDVVVRKGSRRSMQFTNLGIREELLSPNLRGPLELLLSIIEPSATSGEEPYSHSGHEAGLVLQGSLELWVGERCFRLEEGDSFAFASTEPHRCRNPGEIQTKIVWVITPPSY
jgi:transcriptional regulator with XRE-family HTH domain